MKLKNGFAYFGDISFSDSPQPYIPASVPTPSPIACTGVPCLRHVCPSLRVGGRALSHAVVRRQVVPKVGVGVRDARLYLLPVCFPYWRRRRMCDTHDVHLALHVFRLLQLGECFTLLLLLLLQKERGRSPHLLGLVLVMQSSDDVS